MIDDNQIPEEGSIDSSGTSEQNNIQESSAIEEPSFESTDPQVPKEISDWGNALHEIGAFGISGYERYINRLNYILRMREQSRQNLTDSLKNYKPKK
jgi:hypothetical protein